MGEKVNIKKYVQEILWGFPKFVSLLGLIILWRDSGGQALEAKASGIEARAKFLESLLRDDVDLDGEVGLGGFIAVDSRRKLGSDKAVYVEADPGEVRGLRSSVFGEIQGFLDQELSLLFSGELPTLSEPRIFGLPFVELPVGRKFRVLF